MSNNNHKNGERMIVPEKSRFSELFIPDSSDEPAVKARKIAVIVLAAALLILIVYLILVYSGAIKHNEEEPPAAVTAPLTETAVAEVTVTTASETVTSVTEAPETTTETTTTEPLKPLVMLDSMADEAAKYHDTAGHIKIPGTMVNDTVVQCGDNEFYLDHNASGSKYYGGALFMDFRCVVNDYDFNQADNLVIYGHNQKDGTMFGTLQYYKVKKSDTSRFEFYKEHPTFEFSNLYENYTYKIIAMFVSEADETQARDGDIFDAHNFVYFGSSEKRTFEKFEKYIYERTAVLTGVDFNENDKYMTLSTCSNEFEPSRFIVIGRRVRDGESPEVDTSKAEINPDAKEPDYNYIVYGN